MAALDGSGPNLRLPAPRDPGRAPTDRGGPRRFISSGGESGDSRSRAHWRARKRVIERVIRRMPRTLPRRDARDRTSTGSENCQRFRQTDRFVTSLSALPRGFAKGGTTEVAMVGDQPQGPGGASPATAALIEVVPQAAKQVGSVVRARRGLRSDTALVLAVHNGQAEVVWPSGQKELLSLGRIKETVTHHSGDTRSTAGRLLGYLGSKSTEHHRTEAAAATVRRRVDELTQVRAQALGLLLDRRPLSLSLADCLALPIEPWRVRYEFLAQATSPDEGMRDLARAIVSDGSAPSGVRTVVALKFSIPVTEVGPDVELVLAPHPPPARQRALAMAAVSLGQALVEAGVRSASKLTLAVDDPLQLSTSVESAALLAALERSLPPGTRLAVGSMTPLSVVDDLIDRDVPIEVDATSLGGGPDGQASLAAYVAARTDPVRLTSDEVVALGFGSEAVRRYLAGDVAVELALPTTVAAGVKALRSAISGQVSPVASSDPLVRELCAVTGSNGKLAPSEKLLMDRSVWAALIDADVAGSAGTGPLGEEFAGVSALTRASKALFEWRWTEARSIARDGLREARCEEVRDELLNIMACALWLQGEPESALAALDNALEGAYTDALLINASVIATELEHDSAIERLVKLAREAPSAHQRAVAAERALILWINDDERIWEDGEDEDSLPAEIRDALRPLITESLPDDRYLRILRVLATRDDEWLAAQPDSAFGPNAGRAAARIFKARAAGIDDFVKALAAELKSASSEEWVASERDSVVDAAIEVLFERNDELAAAFFGLTVIDADLPMAADQRIALKCLTVASIAANLDPKESEPNERFINFVEESKAELSGLDEDDRARLSGLTTLSAERLTGSYFSSRAHDFDSAIDGYNAIMDTVRTIPARNINKQALREAFAPIGRFCHETWHLFNRLRPLIEDKELIEAVHAMMKQASDIGNRIAEMTR